MWPGARTPPTEPRNRVSPVKTAAAVAVLDEEREHPGVCPGVRSGRIAAADGDPLAARRPWRSRPATSSRSSGLIRTGIPGQRASELAERADVVVVVVGQQDPATASPTAARRPRRSAPAARRRRSRPPRRRPGRRPGRCSRGSPCSARVRSASVNRRTSAARGRARGPRTRRMLRPWRSPHLLPHHRHRPLVARSTARSASRRSAAGPIRDEERSTSSSTSPATATSRASS